MFKLTFVSAALAFAGVAHAHGVLSSPPSRSPGPALQTACGDGVFNTLNSDPAGNIQGAAQNLQGKGTAACQLALCRGLRFDDNKANVQSYPANTVVPIVVDIRAPHTGVANVSIVDTKTNSVIGSPLISFTDAYSTARPLSEQKAATNFDVTIPDLAGKCTTPGDCVVQWWWDARSIDQTYMSCVDFTQGGSAAAPAPSKPAATSTTAAATSSSVAPTSTDVPASSSSEASVPTTSVAESTEVASTSVAEPSSSSAAEPTTSVAAPATTAVPTTAAAPAPTATTGAGDANTCWREYNACLDKTQPRPDFAGCSASRDACLTGSRYLRLARSGSIGRRLSL